VAAAAVNSAVRTCTWWLQEGTAGRRCFSYVVALHGYSCGLHPAAMLQCQLCLAHHAAVPSATCSTPPVPSVASSLLLYPCALRDDTFPLHCCNPCTCVLSSGTVATRGPPYSQQPERSLTGLSWTETLHRPGSEARRYSSHWGSHQAGELLLIFDSMLCRCCDG
jgi:hypothetical protein